MELDQLAGQAIDRIKLADFLDEFAADLSENPDNWENVTRYRFLEAFAAWVRDMDGFYQNIYQAKVPQNPSWEMIAQMMMAARIYE